MTLGAGSEAAGLSFGLQRQGSLTGAVYHDRNGNGRPDSNEPGLAGVEVTLTGSGGGSLTTLTDAAGHYQFAALPPGVYQVQVLTPAAWVMNGPDRRAVNLGGSSAAVASFGCQARGVLGGVIFQDADGDGLQGSSEAGLEGVQVQAWQNGLLAATAVSAPDGSYAIPALAPGAYLLRVTPPAGYAAATPAEQEMLLVDGGAGNAGFGLQPVSTIAGIVFDDLNGDGLRQGYEGGLAGVPVALYTAGADHIFDTADDVLLGERYTASDGAYQFLDQTITSYSVQAAALNGYTATTPSRVVVNLAQFWVAAANFGYQSNNSVGAVTFEDLNGNGVQDPGEPPLSGLPVVLAPAASRIGAADATAYNATTGSLGLVAFRDVPPGSYELRTAPPDSSYVAQRTVATIDVLPNGVASGRFGFQQVGSLTGSIFDDVDGDGRRSAGESGLGGIPVLLTDGAGSELGRQATAPDGSYRFSQLGAGSYAVSVVLPAGYAATSANPIPFTLTATGATAAASVSVGFATTNSISGRVFSDINKNGVQDAGEIGVAGASLQLRRSGAPDRTARTAVNGSYLFALVDHGLYELQLDLPPDFMPTTPPAVTLTVDGVQAPVARLGIRPNLPNRAPVVQAVPDQVREVGETVAIQIAASDPDDTILVYSATGFPAGLAIDSSGGLISGVLPPESAGVHLVNVTVVDLFGGSGQAAFTLTVNAPTALPPTEEPSLPIHVYMPEVYR